MRGEPQGSTSGGSVKGRRSFLAAVFVSPYEPRLRAGWRLILQVVLQFILLMLAGAAILIGVRGIFTGAPGSFTSAQLVVTQIAELAAVTLSIFVARRLLDHRSFASLGLQVGRRSTLDFASGIGITFLMMGLIFATEWMLGWLKLTGFAWQVQSADKVGLNVVVFLVVCLLVGWNEELMSRGYHLQTLASGLTLGWGWILSSTAFGVLHLANPHANWMAVAGIVLAGLFLGYAYVRTGRLWLSIGLHTGWNFFEGVVFGFPVSGIAFYHLARISVSGPELWTGGEFGPEAGLLLIPALALGFGLVSWYTRQTRDA
ncbi:MAG: type II CAAX endopeptidase family protein [Chloroflexota bacterium]